MMNGSIIVVNIMKNVNDDEMLNHCGQYNEL
jgi:hypothetical protein